MPTSLVAKHDSTPSLSTKAAAERIAGLLNEDGDSDPGNPSRALDPTKGSDRDTRGRFRKQAADADNTGDDEVDPDAGGGDDDTDEEEAPARRPAKSEDDDDDTEASETTGDDPDDAGEAIETLEQLAVALGVDAATLQKQLKHTFKASGQDVTASLEEMVAGYQMGADYRRDKSKLGEERRALEMREQQRNQEFVAQSHQLAATFAYAQQALNIELNNPRLQALRVSDPAEWSAAVQDIQMRANSLTEARLRAAAHYEQVQRDQLTALVSRERQALTEAVSDWGPDKVQITSKTLQSLGFVPEELGKIYDHRLITGALELHSLREEVKALKAEKEEAQKAATRVKKEVPRLMKPGKQVASGRVTVDKKRLKQLRQNFNRTRNVRDAGKLIEHML